MQQAALLYEMHMHTPLCKHARGEPEVYAAAAEKAGLRGIVVTCHNPPIDNWEPRVRMGVDEFDAYVAMVDRARQAWAGRIDVRLGLECDYVPGMEQALAEQLSRAEFHHVLGSIHPQLPGYKARFDTGDPVALQRTYFSHLAQAAETGLFDTLAHPDLVKNEHPDEYNLDRIWDVVEDTLDRIAACDVAMELNTSGVNKRVQEMNPSKTILAAMHARGIPVVIGADAHDPHRVAADFSVALSLLQEVGYTETHIVLDRQRRAIPIAAALESLQPVAV